jgi:hypothetical protein
LRLHAIELYREFRCCGQITGSELSTLIQHVHSTFFKNLVVSYGHVDGDETDVIHALIVMDTLGC